MSETRIPISTVGALRRALAGVPDDRMILHQVVAKNGDAWNLFADFCPLADGTYAILTMTHPQLSTLPNDGRSER
jgi:hypothetical protein